MACPDCGVLYCPDCGGVLVPLHQKVDSGKEVTINYCFSCGGYWCDHWKANDITFDDFSKLSKKLPVFDKETAYGGNGKCPYCNVLLETMQVESIPVDLRVKVCPQCQGNWFPQGEFFKFKLAQKTKLDYYKSWNIPIRSIFQILLPMIILVLIGTAIPLSLSLVYKQQDNQIKASEYITKTQVIPLENKKVMIVFSTTIALPSEVEYGQGIMDLKKVPVSVSANTVHQITLSNLEVGKYYYRIILHREGRAIELPLHSFKVNEQL